MTKLNRLGKSLLILSFLLCAAFFSKAANYHLNGDSIELIKNNSKALSSNNFGNNAKVVSFGRNQFAGKTLYWIGGTGDWNDGAHWSLRSGGSAYGSAPTAADNVYFDGKSFSALKQAITIKGTDANCKSMIWKADAGSKAPILTGTSGLNLNIYGSMELAKGMNYDFLGTTRMLGGSLLANAQTIKTNGLKIPFSRLQLYDGRFDLLDDLFVSKLIQVSGQFYTNAHNIQTTFNGSGDVVLTADVTNLNPNASFDISGSNILTGVYTAFHNQKLNYNTTNSTIKVSNLFYISASDGPVVYNDLELTGSNGSISGVPSSKALISFRNVSVQSSACDISILNMKFKNLSFKASSVNRFIAGGIYTIDGVLTANGAPCAPTQFRSLSPGSQYTLTSTYKNFDLKNVSLTDAKAGNGLAQENKYTGINGGNNSNWTYTPITIALKSGSANTTVCSNTAITPIVYTVSGVTGASVTGLPTGVTGVYNAGTLTINGRPTIIGKFNYTVSAIGGCSFMNLTGTIDVKSNATISLANGTANTSVCTSTAIEPIVYAIGGGATGATITGLPSGVASVYKAGKLTISGTPISSGKFTYTVSTTGGCSSMNLIGTIDVTPNATLTLSSEVGTDAQTVCINKAINTISYNVSNATGATVTGLPEGFTSIYNEGKLTINGTPTVSGIFEYTVTTTGGCKTFELTGMLIVPKNANLSLNTENSGPASQTVFINNEISQLVYTVTSATGATVTGLPKGVRGLYKFGRFIISGVPTSVGKFDFKVTTTGGCSSASLEGTITVVGNTYYWVGGSGNWNDGKHWSLRSGGVVSGTNPTEADDVIFDDQSFGSAPNNVVRIGEGGYCRNITVVDPLNEGVFLEGRLYIAGSSDFTGAGTVRCNLYYSGSNTHTITSGKTCVYDRDINFIGKGSYTLMDDLISGQTPGWATTIYHKAGTLNTNGKLVMASSFESFSYYMDGTRALNISNSTIELNGLNWHLDGFDFSSFNSAGSTIKLTAPSALFRTSSDFSNNNSMRIVYNDVVFTAHTGKAQLSSSSISSSYHDVSFKGNGYIDANNSIVENYNLAKGGVYTFELGTYTIGNSVNVASAGNCYGQAVIQSSSQGRQINFKKTSLPFTINSVFLKDVNASASTLTVTNGYSLGNLSNVSLLSVTGRKFYWVGGTGDWNDPSKWSTLGSGKAAQSADGCLPTAQDDVYFDDKSFFEANQSVSFTSDANCKSMIWTASAGLKAPKLVAESHLNLNIYGSLELAQGMTNKVLGAINMVGPRLVANAQTIKTNGVPITNLYLNNGRFDLIDDISLNNLRQYSGQFYSNAHKIDKILGGNGRIILNALVDDYSNINGGFDISGSTITTDSYSGYHNKASNYNTVNSTIVSGYFYIFGINVPVVYNDVTMPGDNGYILIGSTSSSTTSPSPVVAFRNVNVQASKFEFDGPSMKFNNLSLKASSKNKFKAGGIFTVDGVLTADGTACAPTVLSSLEPGVQYTLKSTLKNFNLKNVSLTDAIAGNGSAAENKIAGVNGGNNSNWTFTQIIKSEPTLFLSSGRASTAASINTTITPIVYTVGGSATGATVTGLLTGLSSISSPGKLTISGVPKSAGTFNYSVSTTGGCSSTSLSGTISISTRTASPIGYESGFLQSVGIINTIPSPSVCINCPEETKLFPAAMVTPNGDGKNDTWIVTNIESYPNHTVSIYNRAGTLVFKSRNYKNTWDGTYKGIPLNEDAYFYLIELDGNTNPIKGTITIVRDAR